MENNIYFIHSFSLNKPPSSLNAAPSSLNERAPFLTERAPFLSELNAPPSSLNAPPSSPSFLTEQAPFLTEQAPFLTEQAPFTATTEHEVPGNIDGGQSSGSGVSDARALQRHVAQVSMGHKTPGISLRCRLPTRIIHN